MALRQVSFALLSSLFLFACGGKAPGDACDTTGFLCYDKDSALECRLMKWRELPCRGPTGCSVTGSTVNCDMVGNLEGDACAATVESEGLCDPSGTATLECRQGTLVKTNTCKSCSASGTQVVCQQ